MTQDTVMIHTPTGAIHTVDYRQFREILAEAIKVLEQKGNKEHAKTCREIAGHLIATR